MIRRSACNLGRYHANRAVELHEQSRKLAPTEWGLTAIWRCENFVSAMSLLGHRLPLRLRWRRGWCTPGSCRLAATTKSAESGQERPSFGLRLDTQHTAIVDAA